MCSMSNSIMDTSLLIGWNVVTGSKLQLYAGVHNEVEQTLYTLSLLTA